MGDSRYNIHSQLEHLQSKYVGTGHADTSKFEWLVNQHRDSFASYIGISASDMQRSKERLIYYRPGSSFTAKFWHPNLIDYIAIVENESKERVRLNLLKKCLQPCGPPPEKPDDD